MNFTFAHNNLNVYDLDASLRFYKEALGLTVTRTKEADDGSFKLVYLGDSTTPHKLELTWLRDMDRPYNLGLLSVQYCLIYIFKPSVIAASIPVALPNESNSAVFVTFRVKKTLILCFYLINGF